MENDVIYDSDSSSVSSHGCSAPKSSAPIDAREQKASLCLHIPSTFFFWGVLAVDNSLISNRAMEDLEDSESPE